jgi:predicted nucleotidyltransferase component of viral defense system
MIGTDELKAQAAHLDIHMSNVQRDYVFGWLIAGIYQASRLGEILALKGGNAFRKAYIPETRFSDDLDFSTTASLDPDVLVRELNDACRFVERASGVVFDLDRNRLVNEQWIDSAKRVYKLRLYFKDFAGGADHITISVRVDITEHDRLYLPIQTRQLIHPYSDVSHCSTEIKCVKLEELLADKLKCLLQRRYSYDLFDLAYSLFLRNDLAIDRGEVMRVFFRKTIFEASPAAAKELLLALPLTVFKGFWSKVVCPSRSRVSFESAVDAFMRGVESLFAPFDYGSRAAIAFFPSVLRNPIMEAATSGCTLELTYQGIAREVEPYSLIFKRKRDGSAREYFYGYDLTGGHRSGPGIKAFVPEGFQHIQTTDRRFVPRFAVELSKAGDASMMGQFRGPPNSRPARPHRASGPSLVYIIECSSCGKRFRRSTASAKINAHQDNFGNPCFGRSGFRVF